MGRWASSSCLSSLIRFRILFIEESYQLILSIQQKSTNRILFHPFWRLLTGDSSRFYRTWVSNKPRTRSNCGEGGCGTYYYPVAVLILNSSGPAIVFWVKSERSNLEDVEPQEMLRRLEDIEEALSDIVD